MVRPLAVSRPGSSSKGASLAHRKRGEWVGLSGAGPGGPGGPGGGEQPEKEYVLQGTLGDNRPDFGDGNNSYSITWDGTDLWFARQPQLIYRVEVGTNNILQTIPQSFGGNEAVAMCWDWDRGGLWIGRNGDFPLDLIDPADGSILQTINHSFSSNTWVRGLEYHHNTLWARIGPEVYVVDPEAETFTPLVSTSDDNGLAYSGGILYLPRGTSSWQRYDLATDSFLSTLTVQFSTNSSRDPVFTSDRMYHLRTIGSEYQEYT